MKYDIVEGKPAYVVKKVTELLGIGWELNGELFHRKEDGVVIAAQGVVKKS